MSFDLLDNSDFPQFQLSPPDPRDEAHAFRPTDSAPRGANGGDHIIAHRRERRIQIGPTCGGNSAAFAIGAAYDVAGRTSGEFSGSGLWALAQLVPSVDVDASAGAWLRFIFWSAMRRGAPTREEHGEIRLAPPTAECLLSMDIARFEYKYISSAAGILSGSPLIPGIREAVYSNMPVAIAGLVGTDQGNLVDGGVMDVESEPSAAHAMVVDGIEYVAGVERFRVRDWASQRQYFWATAGFFKFIYEGWAIRAL